ncbi:AcrR family transcriptional regulator [Kineococcus radiotolerans]|uniref:Tetracyclin repressor domain protein n=2 Tax=Kineococcus radiotolerans TaxID=131568 RepID=A6W681_KINRD|nr:TetR/AcrR family transcriptional regulator C-terminal domain-containing protein [Kineococcus radiotolerans]ABS02320.1 Tetracyclin repressor domain protein [Kineococcus radiotolerans SRS30216 = ATCC BAA-149]MBB2900507.1 AcrR family transcriptional regulator [Kineococcus radiotolerans]
MARPTTPLLAREQVLRAALAQIDATGSLALPRLARDLGVGTSSLYHHFRGGREEVVEGIRGLLSTDAMPTQRLPGEDWRAFTRRWATDYRTAYAAHPAAVPLLTAQTVSHPATLASYEVLADVLHEAGFGDEDLLHAVTVLDCFVLGSALDAGAPVEVWADTGAPGSTLSRAIAATRAQPGDRSRRSFELGLEGLLRGLADLLG